jgi:hypothetical protein
LGYPAHVSAFLYYSSWFLPEATGTYSVLVNQRNGTLYKPNTLV